MRRLAVLLSATVTLGACRDALAPDAPVEHSTPFSTGQAKHGDPVPGQYIVVFRKNVQGTESLAKTLAGRHKGKLKHTYKSSLKGMAIELSDSAATALRQDPAVEYVEQDQKVRVSDELIVQPGATSGLDRVDQRFLPLSGTYGYSANGTGVRVYIIDTGIAYGHSEFGGRALFGYDEYEENGSDCHGHGTHVAGTVGGATYGVAKNVRLYAVRVLDCDGWGFTSGVIAGVDWVTSNRVAPAVANMSLGGGFSRALNDAVTQSIAAGVSHVAAAGNSSDDACAYSPGSTPAALTVAATDENDEFAWFSNSGTCVDIDAPGVDITSAWIGGVNATNTISGTSMASPHVAGAAALFLSANRTSTPAQVTSALIANATSGILGSVPMGTVNRLLHTRFTAPSVWTPLTGLPAARRGIAIGVANHLVYGIGGVTSADAALTTVQAYNPSTNTWTNKAPLPAARQTGNGAVTINSIMYLAGGHDAAGKTTRTLYVYNATTNAWSIRAAMPVFSSCGGSAVLGGKVYVFSGCTRNSAGTQIAAGLLHRYDPATNAWTTLRAAPTTVHFQPVVAAISGKLYVIGGVNSSGVATGRVDRYDPATNSWTTRAAMPTARVGSAGSAIGGRIIVFGGRTGTTYLNAVEAYDPLTNSWSSRASMPTARAALGVGGVSGLLYAIGGRNSSGVLTTNERFTP